jgi:pyruvate/2-oxoglutarate dehydrogenase complex dihydrolipoamide acyltransferase (E2) component
MPSTITGVESEIRSVAQDEIELVCDVHRVEFDGREEEEPRLVEDLGVDLSQIEGTGSGGRITVKDVTEAAK